MKKDNLQKPVPALLKELSVVLPGVELTGLNLDQLMSFDVHNLEAQYSNDVTVYSLFSILSKEAAHLVLLKKDELEYLEAILEDEAKTLLKDRGERATEKSIMSFYLRDPRFIQARNNLRETQHQAAILEGIVDSLNKKHISLTMISARQKAEIQGRIS